MDRFTLSLIFLVIAVQIVSGRFLNDGGRFEINDGNCDGASGTDRVFERHLTKYAIPLVTHRVNINWSGDKTIYCLLVTSENDASEGSLVYIKGGGVNNEFVDLEVDSKQGHGLDYMIKVFAK